MSKWMPMRYWTLPGGHAGLADLFAALASDVRIRILELLRQGPRFGWELQPDLHLDQSVISRHLATLRRVGLVRGEKQGTAVRFFLADERVFQMIELARTILASHVEKQRVLLDAGRTAEAEQESRRQLMRIAFAAETNEGLNSAVSAHFGRCPFYVFVDVDADGKVEGVEAVENPFYYDHGAPGQVPGFIASRGAQVMVSGGMGPRALAFFQQLGIEAVTGASGTVREALGAFLDREITGAEPCAEHGEGHYEPDREMKTDSVTRELQELREQARALEERIEALRRLAEQGGGRSGD